MNNTIIIFICCFFLVSCVWSSETRIGGDYFLVAGGQDHRWISKVTNEDRKIVIDQQIIGIRVIDSFAFVHRKVAISYECSDSVGQKTIMTNRTEDDEYWILNLTENIEWGPYNYSEMQAVANTYLLGKVRIRQDVPYRSNTSGFESRIAHCNELVPISYGRSENLNY